MPHGECYTKKLANDKAKKNLPLTNFRFIKTHTYTKAFLEMLEKEGIKFASYEDAVRAVLRCASDTSINGRSIGILPREYCASGYVDLAQDDYALSTNLAKWQDITLRLGMN